MDKNLTFKTKREDLELFVKEQIIGPGAFNKRFFLLEKWNTNEFCGQNLKTVLAFNNVSEILSEVPAYQYSSAILFPISTTAEELFQKEENTNEESAISDDENLSPLTLDDENLKDDSSESVSSKNQNYPNTCGIAFAINQSANISDLSLQVNFRTYQKLSNKQCRDNKLAYWISDNNEMISEIFKKYYSDIFQVTCIDQNTFVYLKEGVDVNEHLYTLDYVNFEKYVVANITPLIDEFLPNNSYYIFSKSKYNDTEFTYTKIYEENIYDFINDSIKDNRENYFKLSTLIEGLEIYNQIKNIVNELKAIYRKSSLKNRPTPIWQSTLHSKVIKLKDYNLNTKTVRDKFSLEIDGVEDLFINYQYINYGDNGTYIKLILTNEKEIKISSTEPPQLNKKDEANEKSFFGVELKIIELKNGILKPYNPPNLIEIDEEDSFNKIIYRQYKDYGEGYNTSVDWGQTKDGLRFLSSEFMPEQETPKIDFQPSRAINNEIIPRINESVLSMRDLSTLSSLRDEEIILRLNGFISEYNKWINEKKLELASENINKNALEILHRQLNACENDAKRLFRNIKLLEGNRKAMTAFRLMNTAMFMQLHHSKKVKLVLKENFPPFTPDKSLGLETYYKTVVLEKDYEWRSFQLAFVLLNIDSFVKPDEGDKTVKDVFKTGWPERNEIADLVWFPTGGGKTEAYLGIIAFAIAYRRFIFGVKGNGTTALMRYTLRLLTLQQFQRATLLICALEVIRKENFFIPNNFNLGEERITIGLFVGGTSLPNEWDSERSETTMVKELEKIKEQLRKNKRVETNLPHTNCPWCGSELFIDDSFPNLHPNLTAINNYKNKVLFKIMCNTKDCTFSGIVPNEKNSLPLRLLDEDVYKAPPTLLFGTVDKFAALANKVSKEINLDSRRILGKRDTEKGKNNVYPPELIIQDELHLLLGPLGSAVGLFEKGIDMLCSYKDEKGLIIRPKIITSTATTRNTDKQIFALFNRRSEIFPKQGINCDDSFFAYYQREKENIFEYASNRKYVGLLPVGKTQVWMQLRIASISLSHRLKFIKENFCKSEIFSNDNSFKECESVLDYYHTVLSYFNSLKEVGKTQSQLSHYLPGDLNLIIKNTMQWDFLNKLIKPKSEIDYSELTGRLTGEEVKTNLSDIERNWNIKNEINPPEFIIATNMISVGIDVSRFNTMIINSMPRNTAEYIQASSRVARDKEGIVFTIHHPFRSRDISHYQRFKEYHEKFYSYVEPISVTPFTDKALERYFAMFLAVIVRHNADLPLSNNDDARDLNQTYVNEIRFKILNEIKKIKDNAVKLNEHLSTRDDGLRLNIYGIIEEHEYAEIEKKIDELLITRWLDRIQDSSLLLKYRDESISNISLFQPRNGFANNNNWNVKQSLREIAPSVVIKTVQQ